MKKIIALLLVVVMVSSFAGTVFADSAAILNCSASNAVLSPGNELSITVSLSNSSDAKSVALVFDYDVAETFDLIGGEWLLSGALIANFDSNTTACGTAAIAYAALENVNGDIFVLTLKVKDTAQPGAKTITVSPVIKSASSTEPCENASVTVRIKSSAACAHTNKTFVEERVSTTEEQGWDAYYRCDECGQLFAADGITEIDEIPYRPLLTVTGAFLSCGTATINPRPGDEVEIVVSLQNAPVAKSVALVFDYDITDTFTLVDGRWQLTGGFLSDFSSNTVACGAAVFAYADPSDINGNIFKLTLKIKEAVEPGEKAITVSPVIKNGDETIDCESASILLTVVKGNLRGDADGDGEITVADALAALRVAAKLVPETPEMIAVCDTDGDGAITVADALQILRVAAKLVSLEDWLNS